MRADNTAHLVAATRRRHELARSKAIRAIGELDASGTTVTFESVARAAGGVQILALHPARHPCRGAAAARPRPPGTRDVGAGPPPQQGTACIWCIDGMESSAKSRTARAWLALIKPDCNCPSYFTVIISL